MKRSKQCSSLQYITHTHTHTHTRSVNGKMNRMMNNRKEYNTNDHIYFYTNIHMHQEQITQYILSLTSRLIPIIKTKK